MDQDNTVFMLEEGDWPLTNDTAAPLGYTYTHNVNRNLSANISLKDIQTFGFTVPATLNAGYHKDCIESHDLLMEFAQGYEYTACFKGLSEEKAEYPFWAYKQL